MTGVVYPIARESDDYSTRPTVKYLSFRSNESLATSAYSGTGIVSFWYYLVLFKVTSMAAAESSS